MSTSRSTDDRDTDARRHREIMDGLARIREMLEPLVDRPVTPPAYRDVPDLVPPLEGE